jgi:hypothetical protein
MGGAPYAKKRKDGVLRRERIKSWEEVIDE